MLISPDDGPGDVREMTKWSLLVLDMYSTTDLHANNVRFMTKHFLLTVPIHISVVWPVVQLV